MIKKTLLDISKNFEILANSNLDVIEQAKKLMIKSIDSKNKIMFCGNGGSAADSQHLAAELLGRYQINREPLAAIALSTDTSSITAIANDFSFNEIFSRQIKALGNPGDILYAISTSGNSKNILSAIKCASEMNINVIGITGQDGGLMNEICDVLIKVPSTRADRIQEMHIAIGQILCENIESHFFS